MEGADAAVELPALSLSILPSAVQGPCTASASSLPTRAEAGWDE